MARKESTHGAIGSSVSGGVKTEISEGAAEPVSLSIAPPAKTNALPVAGTGAATVGLTKRIFDIVGASVIGVLVSPLIVIIAVTIRVSGSPVFFSHKRVGLGHKTFSCYKFRSMVPNAEEVLLDLLHADPKVLMEWRENHKLRNDPRVTRLGNFLRKTSLDELPQLWNVIKGDMSLVGPRPVVPDEIARYGNTARKYCCVRPGMTGLWQISGRNHVTYSRRVSMDVLYIRRQSVMLDTWILWRTLIVVIKRVGAY